MTTKTTAQSAQDFANQFSKEEIGDMNLWDIAKHAWSIEEWQAMLKRFVWPMLEKMMQAELDEHLGYDKNSIKGNNSWNSRNWTYSKSILTSSWREEMEVPRDRNWTYEPQILPKYQKGNLMTLCMR